MTDVGYALIVVGAACFFRDARSAWTVVGEELGLGLVWIAIWIGFSHLVAWQVNCCVAPAMAAAAQPYLTASIAVAAWLPAWAMLLLLRRRWQPAGGNASFYLLRAVAAAGFWKIAILGHVALDRPGGWEAAAAALLITLIRLPFVLALRSGER